LDGYRLHPKESQINFMAVSESVHWAWSFRRGSSLGRPCTTGSLWRYPCNLLTACSASLCTVGIAASCGTRAGSLVCGGGCCSVPGTSYRWWSWLVPAGSLRGAGEWCRGWNSRTVYTSSAVGVRLVVRGVSRLIVSRRLWLWSSLRMCSLWYLWFLCTKGSHLCLVYSIGAAVVVWRFIV
jgi:hypothetical protein